MRSTGIERERFITNPSGDILPAIGTLLPSVHAIAHNKGIAQYCFTYELFAGQIEDRTLPCVGDHEVAQALLINDEILEKAAASHDLLLECSELIEESRVQKFIVNPFNKRHQTIWESLPYERRVAASIVAGVHVHLQVTDDEAVRTLNRCRDEVINELIDIGDHSNRMRISTYQTMAKTTGVPPLFDNMSEIIHYIESKGGEKNVWDLVRYKPSTHTIEFRMFGATSHVDEVLGYVTACRSTTKL